MSKEKLISEAERLGVSLEGLTWPQQQKAVLDAKKQAGEEIHYEQKRETKQQLPDVNYIISAEIPPKPIQLVKYDEELGEDLDVEEVSLDTRDAGSGQYNTKTYKVRRTGRKVVAQSTAPKENCGIEYNPARDMFPKTIWEGRVGYVWRYVKRLLIDSGYYYDYEKELNDPSRGYIWYAGNKILTVDINKVHSIFREIERKERERKELYGDY